MSKQQLFEHLQALYLIFESLEADKSATVNDEQEHHHSAMLDDQQPYSFTHKHEHQHDIRASSHTTRWSQLVTIRHRLPGSGHPAADRSRANAAAATVLMVGDQQAV